MTDDQLIERWLESRRSALTREGYASDFERFRQFIGIDKPLASVELGDVQRYAKHLTRVKVGVKRKTKMRAARQARLLNVVKSFYAFATKHNYLPHNPTLAVVAPKAENALAERLLSRDDVERLIAAEEHPRNQLMLRVIFYSGARVSEAINIQWRHVRANQQGGQITLFGKGAETRVVVVPSEIYGALLAERERVGGKVNDYVFSSPRGPLSRQQVTRIVKKAAKKAGLTHAVSTHWLRHANATIALQNGASLPLIQQTLGHRSPIMTMRYTHAMPNDSTGLYLDKKK